MTVQQLGQRQGVELALTAGMQQSLQILRMGNRDVTGLLREEAERNPFLRLTGGAAASSSGPTGQEAEAVAGTGSLGDHVAHQIGLLFRDPLDRAAAKCRATALEPTGWLGTPLATLAEDLAIPLARAQDLLARLQEMEPAGLFATSLRNCLELQARDAGILDATLARVLAHLDLLGQRNPQKAFAELGLSPEDLARALAVIRGFDPKPGLRFAHDVARILTPDLKVTSDAGTWRVEVNDAAIPVIRVDDRPMQLPGRQNHRALKELARRARDLDRMVNRRKQTLVLVGAAVILRQQAFLRDGRMAMLPLSLGDVAEETGLHISTVSRAVSSTLIETPKGTLPLRAFFSRAVEVGQGVVAQGSLAALIASIVSEENPRQPMTDQQITTTIHGMGMTITRRTVANHRKALNIPRSEDRAAQNR